MHGVSDGRTSVIAIDIGGTTVKGAVFDSSGVTVGQSTVDTFSDGRNAEESVTSLVADLFGVAASGGTDPVGVGVAVPGLIDSSAGVVTYAANLQWSAFPLADRLRDVTGLPVTIDHDARVGARAEIEVHNALRGSSPVRDLLYVPIGTGVAVAVVSAGEILEGATGAAGEFGHVVVAPGGELCACGQRGCLEAYVSGANMTRRYLAASGERATSAAEIAALIGIDPNATQVWMDAVEALAAGLATLTAVLDPQEVILGGGVSLAREMLAAPLRSSLQKRLPWRAAPPISWATLGAGSALVGAALMAWGPSTPQTFRESVLSRPSLLQNASRN